MLRWMVWLSLVGLSALDQQKAPPVDLHIGGVVVDSVTGHPLSKARVNLAPVVKRTAVTSFITAEDGKFYFAGLASGKYSLNAERHGYVAQAFKQHETFSTAIAVRPDIESGQLVFRLAPEAVIFGTVLDDWGEAVRGAQVRLFQSTVVNGSTRTGQRSSTTTDDEGIYRFAHLPAGRYFIAASATPWYAQHPSAGSAGRSFVADGQSMSGGGVSVGSAGASADGAEISPLDVAYPTTFYSGATEADGATAIEITNGHKAAADVTLNAMPAAHFRITNGTADQKEMSFVVLEGKGFNGAPLSIQTQTIESTPGVLEVVGIAPGRYSMQTHTVSENRDHFGAQDREIQVSGSGEVDVLAASLRVPVSATIHSEPPGSIPNQALIQLQDRSSGRVFTEPINSKGEAEFNEPVPPGSYALALFRAPDFFIHRVAAAGAAVAGHTVKIKGGSPVKLNVLVVHGQGAVSGTALRDGAGVAGAMIVLVPADPVNDVILFRRDQSDSDGTFTLADVVPGHYTLVAIENGWDLEWMNPEVLKKFTAQGEPVIVEVKGKYSVKVKVQ